ncbi:MAG: hypothetical protein HFE84_07975 [Lachnospiraceae bacterium]|nr:hypothetical protein [Lachnospiraceae bacterium]
MDERVVAEYRRIYSELTSILVVFSAAALVIKLFFFEKTSADCVTEMVILVGTPIYMTVRQYMLGLDPEAAMPAGRRRKKAVTAVIAGILGFAMAVAAKRGEFGLWSFEYILTFVVAFSFIYYISGRLAKYFAEKKNREYEDP